MGSLKHLSAKARRFVADVQGEFDLDTHHVELLVKAAEQMDRADEARKIVEKHGVLIEDRFGAMKENPAVSIERNASITMSRLLRELGLDLNDVSDFRPPR